MIKISVVVPVYNAERYLIKCINSIMNQSFNEEYELILVNDGSEDHSEDIIDKKIEEFGLNKIIKVNQKMVDKVKLEMQVWELLEENILLL